MRTSEDIQKEIKFYLDQMDRTDSWKRKKDLQRHIDRLRREEKRMGVQLKYAIVNEDETERKIFSGSQEISNYLGIRRSSLDYYMKKGGIEFEGQMWTIHKSEIIFRFYIGDELDYEGPIEEASEDLEMTTAYIRKAARGDLGTIGDCDWTVKKVFAFRNIFDENGNCLEA